MKRILFKDAHVALADGLVFADVLIEGEKIIGVFEEGHSGEDCEVVDCSDKVLMPGVIDGHVHFREPGAAHKEDWEHASASAAAGGVTTVLDMPNNNPFILTVKDLEDKRNLIKGRSYVDYGFHFGYRGGSVDDVLSVKNVPAVKVYVANSTGDMGVDVEMLDSIFRDSDKLIMTHAEDETVITENYKKFVDEVGEDGLTVEHHSKIRSVEAARRAVELVCSLAEKYKKRLHVAHISTEAELEVIMKYKEKGVMVTCEVAPHHLSFNTDDYEKLGNLIKVNPPIRSSENLFAMWKGLKFGHIDIIATDHAPHTLEEKGQPYLKAPSGVPGVEFLLPFVLNSVNDEAFSWQEVVKLLCSGPANIFGIKEKGKIEVGYDADLVLVDMEVEKEITRAMVKSKCGWSPYEGWKLKGWPVMTYLRGNLVFKDGEFGEKIGAEAQFS